jgi:hypothetical protein
MKYDYFELLIYAVLVINVFIIAYFGYLGYKDLTYEKLPLEKLLNSEIIELGENMVCRDYVKYYNETLSQKYPELDIRVIRYADICGIKNDNKNCTAYHTYLVVNGYCNACLLDQQNLLCEELKC